MIKNNFEPSEIFVEYLDATNKSKCLKEYCKKKGIPFENRYFKRMRRFIAKDTPLVNSGKMFLDTVKNHPKTFETPSAVQDGRILSIEEYCNKYGLDQTKIKSYSLLTHNKNNINYNIEFQSSLINDSFDLKEIEKIINKNVKPIKVEPITRITNVFDFDRLVYTDVHIGMSPDGQRNVVPLYKQSYKLEDISKRLDLMIKYVIQNKKSDVLIIDDLGDFIDGFNGETVRKGHPLPQNMDDREMFETGIAFKIKLIESLLPYYSSIYCHNIINDNHSFMASYYVNSTVEHLVKVKYKNYDVKYVIFEQFINYYHYKNHLFLLSHGKDATNLKFGFKPQLDTVQAEKIDQFLKEFKLYNNDLKITFCKGDSHQMVLDYTTSSDFNYFSYPAFCVGSDWVNTNYKKQASGFVFENYKNNIQTVTPIFFNGKDLK